MAERTHPPRCEYSRRDVPAIAHKLRRHCDSRIHCPIPNPALQPRTQTHRPGRRKDFLRGFRLENVQPPCPNPPRKQKFPYFSLLLIFGVQRTLFYDWRIMPPDSVKLGNGTKNGKG